MTTLFGDEGFEVKKRPFDKLKDFLTSREVSSYKKLALFTNNTDLLCRVLFMADHLMTVEYEHENPEHRILRAALDELEEKIGSAR